MKRDQRTRASATQAAAHSSGGRRRVVRLHLDPLRYELLERLASEVELSADQLATVWLHDRVDNAYSVSMTMRAAPDLSLDQPPATRRTTPRASRGRTAAPTRRKGSLHGEIVNVLRQNGGPMTAAEIAEAIRQRGEYRAPRSGHPISGAAISRRVANPYYRSLFERAGRQVGLAGGSRTTPR